MAGSKRNKLKKALSPPQHSTPPTIMNDDDEELMHDLLAQLDSRDQNVQAESANVLNDMQLNKQADEIDARQKQDSKARFQARKVKSTVETVILADMKRYSDSSEKPQLWSKLTRRITLKQTRGCKRKPRMKRLLSNECVTN